MVGLRLAMDAAFWDLNVSSAQTLEGTVRSVPGEPTPLSTARSSRVARQQQLSFLGRVAPLGIFPCFAPTPNKELGGFSLQSLLGHSSSNWWVGLVGQFRPRKLISNIKKEVMSGDELDLPAVKDIAKHVLDKSLYALGLFSQVSLTDYTSLVFNVERHGERKGPRSKATLFHQLPHHDITLEAAWPELFLDSKGTYWEVPASASLDIASLVSDSGLRYRFGLHKNSGHPEALNPSSDDVPLALMPGICAKAAFSYEKSRDLWRDKLKRSNQIIQAPVVEPPSYDIRLEEPHAAISGIIGGTCAAWFGGNEKTSLKAPSGDGEVESVSLQSKKRSKFTADLFGSLCYTFQHGKFRNDFNDFSRVDARLDIYSASSFVKGMCHILSDVVKDHVDRKVDPLASPKLNVLLQQQVLGPIVFRVDSRLSLSSPSGKPMPQVEDVIFGLSYSIMMLDSGKILAWFSPKRKEAMLEFRMFEF